MKRKFRFKVWVFTSLLFVALLPVQSSTAQRWNFISAASTGLDPSRLEPITVENVGQLRVGAVFGWGTVENVAWSPDGKLIAVATSAGILLHQAASPNAAPRFLADYTISVINLVFSPDSTRLVANSGDNALHVWDLAKGEPMLTLQGHQKAGHVLWLSGIAYSPDGKQIAAASSDGTVIVWDAMTGHEIIALQSDNGEPN